MTNKDENVVIFHKVQDNNTTNKRMPQEDREKFNNLKNEDKLEMYEQLVCNYIEYSDKIETAIEKQKKEQEAFEIYVKNYIQEEIKAKVGNPEEIKRPDIDFDNCRVVNNLKEVLVKHGDSQAKLADRIGISSKTLSNIVSNRFNTSLDVALKIAYALNEPLEKIFKLENIEK